MRVRGIRVWKIFRIKENQEFLNSSEFSKTHSEFFWILSEISKIINEISEINYEIFQIISVFFFSFWNFTWISETFLKLPQNPFKFIKTFWVSWKVHSKFFRNLNFCCCCFEKYCELIEILTNNWIVLECF